MITVKEAQAHVAALLTPTPSEEIDLADGAGRVLLGPVTAKRHQPPFPASAMDGYAVRSADITAGADLTVIGEVAAGHANPLTIGPGEAVRIFTGGVVPDGADRILIQEDAERTGDTITVSAGFDTKSYVRPAGTDFEAGFRIDGPRRLKPFDLSLIASMGVGRIPVARKPVIAVIPTGDELVWPGEDARDDQISASNHFGLKAMLESEGAIVRLLPIAKDTHASLRAALSLTQGADLIVTLGGASVGDHDLVQDVAKGEGLDLSFYKLAMRPGKPLMAGRLGETPMIGLPGNPVSSLVCGHIFLKPAVGAFLGLGYHAAPVETARLACDLGANGPREHYMRAHVTQTDGGWECTPFERQDSSLLSVLSDANALMIRPPSEAPLKAGSVVKFTHI